MSAFKKIGIIAGGGALPAHIAASCGAADIFVVGFEGQSDPAFVEAHDHMWTKIGQTGAVLKALRAKGLTDLVLIGALKRPDWSAIRLDFKTVGFLTRYGAAMMGDDGLLRALRDFLQREGFSLHGAHVIAPDLLMSAGVLGAVQPSAQQLRDIKMGFAASQDLGRADVGQAVVVHDCVVIAHEDVGGTDAMIKQTAVKGAILVKSCKPQQDVDLDMPTAGLCTIETAYRAGFAGVALHTGRSMMLDRAAVIAYADANDMFVMGIDGDE